MMKRYLNLLLLAVLAVFSILPESGNANEHRWFPKKPNHRSTFSCENQSEKRFWTPPVQGTWTPLINQPTFLTGGATSQMLLTDGSVLIRNNGFEDIWKLTPDSFGRYENGTWSQLAPLPKIPSHIDWPIQYSCRPSADAPNQTQYAPSSYASAVLADGRVIFAGGESNGSDFEFVLTNMCAIYDPVADSWTPVLPPPFFIDEYAPRATFAPNCIADAASVVLPDGTFIVQDKMSRQAALLDLSTMTWRETGTSTKTDLNDEEGWTLLPNGKVLTTDCYNGQYFIPELYGNFPASLTNSEIYDPETGRWSSAGSTILTLTDPDLGEVGPAVLRPDGKVICFGGTTTGQNVLYDSKENFWSVTEKFPFGPGDEGQLTCADAAAALLPNGNVLVGAGLYNFAPSIHFFEYTFDTNVLLEQPNIPKASEIGSYACNMLILPTGQILLTTITNDIEIYTPGDRSYNEDWAPKIEKVSKKVKAGHTYKIGGVLFNGMSQGSAYGDNYQSATNYPIVRITNCKTNHVFYCRTHDHSSMAVASQESVHTYFDLPYNIESGESMIEVVANGIPSKPVYIKVKS